MSFPNLPQFAKSSEMTLPDRFEVLFRFLSLFDTFVVWLKNSSAPTCGMKDSKFSDSPWFKSIHINSIVFAPFSRLFQFIGDV